MPGYVQHTTMTTAQCTPQTCAEFYWRPVPGQLVFAMCVLLIVACLVWLGMLAHKGKKFEES